LHTSRPIPCNPAGFWIRLTAALLDALLVGFPLLFLSYLITGRTEGNPIPDLLSFLYALLVPIYWNGYTLGKKIMRVRIVKINGQPAGFGTMLLRLAVAGIFYGLTFGILFVASAIMVAFREDKRSVHDLIAGTYVTKNPPLKQGVDV